MHSVTAANCPNNKHTTGVLGPHVGTVNTAQSTRHLLMFAKQPAVFILYYAGAIFTHARSRKFTDLQLSHNDEHNDQIL